MYMGTIILCAKQKILQGFLKYNKQTMRYDDVNYRKT